MIHDDDHHHHNGDDDDYYYYYYGGDDDDDDDDDDEGPFKCYVTLFFWKLDPHPPPRNPNNIERYTFVTLLSRKSDTPTHICVT